MQLFGFSHRRPPISITSDSDTNDTDERNMTMAARTNWKVLTVGAALAGLGITGAGIAMADSDGSESSQIKPIEVSAAQEPTAPVGDKVDRGADDLGGK